MADPAPAIARVLEEEGPYSNDPSDSGGETAWGITEAEARAGGWQGPMREFPQERAIEQHYRPLWARLMLDKVADQLAAELLFDCAVNQGEQTSARIMQRALNALNLHGQQWPDVIADGFIGPMTVAVLNACCRIPTERIRVLGAALSMRGARYVETGEKREANEDFEDGWFDNRVLYWWRRLLA